MPIPDANLEEDISECYVKAIVNFAGHEVEFTHQDWGTDAGLAHKKDWKANRRAWHKMDKKRRLLIIISMIVLGAVIAAAITLTIIRN